MIMTKNESYTGKVAFVSGAANGVGHARVLAFAPERVGYSKGLVWLGRIENGVKGLAVSDAVPIRIERLP